MVGVIKKLTDKGFGFISSDEVEKDVFFHSSVVKDATFEELREGDSVNFEYEKSERGLNATEVSKA